MVGRDFKACEIHCWGWNFFFLISKKKYIKRTSRKQEANERVQRGTQTKRKHKRKQKAERADKNYGAQCTVAQKPNFLAFPPPLQHAF